MKSKIYYLVVPLLAAFAMFIAAYIIGRKMMKIEV